MAETKLKEVFLRKITEELAAFKISILGKDKEYIFAEAYKIDSYITLYESLVASVDEIQVAVMIALLRQTGRILESILSDYSEIYGDQYSNMEKYIKNMEA